MFQDANLTFSATDLLIDHAPALFDPSPVQGGPIHWFVDFATGIAGYHNVTVEHLDLLRPIYSPTAAYRHFGRPEKSFTWEKTDMAAELKEALLPKKAKATSKANGKPAKKKAAKKAKKKSSKKGATA